MNLFWVIIFAFLAGSKSFGMQRAHFAHKDKWEGLDEDLTSISEELFSLDVNSVGELIHFNNVYKLTSVICNLTIPDSAFEGPTITRFVPLLDNYNADPDVPDVLLPETEEEKKAFLDVILNTSVMSRTEEFLTAQGYITEPLRSVLDRIWFTSYPRVEGILGSSGFEHIFVEETHNGRLYGHNWITFQNAAKEGRIIYKGCSFYNNISDKVDTFSVFYEREEILHTSLLMWLGSSPELEMAYYTICFFARRNDLCLLQLNGHQFRLHTRAVMYNEDELVYSGLLYDYYIFK